MAKWFYLIDGQPAGPLEPAALKQLATTGCLKPTDKVRREDLKEWYEARQVKGLFPSTKSPIASAAAVTTATTPAGRSTVTSEPKGNEKSGNATPTPIAEPKRGRLSAKKTILALTAAPVGCGCLVVLMVLFLPLIQAGREVARRGAPSASEKSDSSPQAVSEDRALKLVLREVVIAENELRATLAAIGGAEASMISLLIQHVNHGPSVHGTFDGGMWKYSSETQRDWQTWRAAFIALNRLANIDPDIVQKLAIALNDDDSLVGQAAAWALLRKGDNARPALPSIIECVKGSNEEAIIPSYLILEKLSPNEAISLLQLLSQNKSERIKSFAESLIEKRNQPRGEGAPPPSALPSSN